MTVPGHTTLFAQEKIDQVGEFLEHQPVWSTKINTLAGVFHEWQG